MWRFVDGVFEVQVERALVVENEVKYPIGIPGSARYLSTKQRQADISRNHAVTALCCFAKRLCAAIAFSEGAM